MCDVTMKLHVLAGCSAVEYMQLLSDECSVKLEALTGWGPSYGSFDPRVASHTLGEVMYRVVATLRYVVAPCGSWMLCSAV
jgi:hypothetical protein